MNFFWEWGILKKVKKHQFFFKVKFFFIGFFGGGDISTQGGVLDRNTVYTFNLIGYISSYLLAIKIHVIPIW